MLLYSKPKLLSWLKSAVVIWSRHLVALPTSMIFCLYNVTNVFCHVLTFILASYQNQEGEVRKPLNQCWRVTIIRLMEEPNPCLVERRELKNQIRMISRQRNPQTTPRQEALLFLLFVEERYSSGICYNIAPKFCFQVLRVITNGTLLYSIIWTCFFSKALTSINNLLVCAFF